MSFTKFFIGTILLVVSIALLPLVTSTNSTSLVKKADAGGYIAHCYGGGKTCVGGVSRCPKTYPHQLGFCGVRGNGGLCCSK